MIVPPPELPAETQLAAEPPLRNLVRGLLGNERLAIMAPSRPALLHENVIDRIRLIWCQNSHFTLPERSSRNHYTPNDASGIPPSPRPRDMSFRQKDSRSDTKPPVPACAADTALGLFRPVRRK